MTSVTIVDIAYTKAEFRDGTCMRVSFGMPDSQLHSLSKNAELASGQLTAQ